MNPTELTEETYNSFSVGNEYKVKVIDPDIIKGMKAINFTNNIDQFSAKIDIAEKSIIFEKQIVVTYDIDKVKVKSKGTIIDEGLANILKLKINNAYDLEDLENNIKSNSELTFLNKYTSSFNDFNDFKTKFAIMGNNEGGARRKSSRKNPKKKTRQNRRKSVRR